MIYGPEVIDQVRRAVDIVDVIDSVVPLRKAGASWKACCPFHKEKTPSFHVSAERQSFKCFGCGVGGDVFKFIQLYENVEFPEALRRAAARGGVTLPERSGADDGRREIRRALLGLHAEIAAYWRDLLLHDPRGEPARRYMHEREIPLGWAKEFGLGYAPEAWDDTVRWARERKLEDDLLFQSGLLKRHEESGRLYDFFRGRLIFPISNDSGEVIAFSARLLDPNAKAAKYINSPESPVFSKGRVLFGLHRAKRAILDADRVVVCEGQIDVLRCHAAGIANVVAPLGTAFTEDHARILRRQTRNVVLCLDGDRAGQAAAERVAGVLLGGGGGMERLVQSDLGIQVVRLPESHDPDSFIRAHGGDRLRELLAQPVDYLDFLVDLQLGRHGREAAGRRRAVEAVAQFLAQIPNAAYREQLLQQASTRLQTSPQALAEEVARQRKPARPAASAASPGPASDPAGPAPETAAVAEKPCDPEVRELIAFVIAQPERVGDLLRVFSLEWVRDRPGADLLELAVEWANDGMLEGAESFAGHVDAGALRLLQGLRVESLRPVNSTAFLEGIARKCRATWAQGQILLISRKMADPALRAEEKTALLRRLVELKNSLTPTG